MIRLFEMFAGYGGASFALKKAGIPFECVGYSEIDKYAIQCYEQNHSIYENKGPVRYRTPVNQGDCSKIVPEDLPDFDLLTAGFPCQDVSIAGERDLTKGRTMLVHDIFRIAAVKKPKYIVLENVKGLISTEPLWTNIKWTIKKLGYDLKYKVLNSKEHGIPQNRERIWIICSLDGFEPFVEIFPQKEKLKILLKDILEDEIDEKYYLKESQVKSLLQGMQKIKVNHDVAASLQHPGHSAGNYKGMNLIQLNNPTHSNDRVYSKEGVSPTLNTMTGGNRQPFILDLYNKKFKEDGISICLTEPHHNNLRIAVPEATKQGYAEAEEGDSINISNPNSKTRRGRVGKSVAQTLETQSTQVTIKDYRIRRLTPKECFRLMGFLNDEIKLEGLSDTQKYKLAGNGWDINVVSKIFKNILGGKNGN